jgi:hypothetical protein
MLIRYCPCGASSKTTRFHPTRKQCEDCANAKEAARAERLAILRPSPIAVEPVREADPDRNEAHMGWVRTKTPCSVHGWACTGRAVAHHDRTGQSGGTGMKPPDRRVVRLCEELHDEGHLIGWKSFSAKYGVDLSAVADRNEAASPYLKHQVAA